MNDANYVDGIIVIPATGLCRQLGQMDSFPGNLATRSHMRGGIIKADLPGEVRRMIIQGQMDRGVRAGTPCREA
jgi:hypothetical protein